MKLLDDLKAMGLVSQRPLIRRDIEVEYYPPKPVEEWANPEIEEREDELAKATVTVYLKKYRVGDIVAMSQIEPEEDRVYFAIHRSVCDESGAPLFPTLQDAKMIGDELLYPIVSAISDLNGTKKKS